MINWPQSAWVERSRKRCFCFVLSFLPFSSVQFSRSAVSNSLWPHGLQHTSLPVHHQLLEPAQTHVHWVSDAIQPSHPLSHPSPPAFNLSQHQSFSSEFFTSDGQSFGVSASASVLPMNIQDWFPLGLAGWISLQSKELSRVFSNTKSSKASIFQRSAFFPVQFSHP